MGGKGVSTRSTGAGTVDENRVACLHILEYQNGLLTDRAYVDQLSDTVFEVKLTPGTANLYFVANVPSDTFDAAPADETTFLNDVLGATSEQAALYPPGEGLQCIPMSASLKNILLAETGYPDTQRVELTRMLARIDLDYTVQGDANNAVELHTLRLCNLVKGMRYDPPSGLYPASPVSGDFFSTSYEYPASSQGTLTFYVPENLRGAGTNGTTDERYKTGVEYATYVELTGRGILRGSAGYACTFRLYPGGDAYNDYNLKRNTFYRMTTRISGLSLSDARLQRDTVLANCYRVSPGDSVFIPVAQANRSELGTQITDVYSDSWTPVLIWQSSPDLVEVEVPAYGRRYGQFKVVARNATKGNALVGVKDAGGNILWSWHIWITDYDPDRDYVTYYGYQWMKYNLGQTSSVESPDSWTCGCLYQWGRKEPFPPSRIMSSVSQAAPVDAQGGAVGFPVVQITAELNYENSVRNPTTFYCDSEISPDWYSTTGASYSGFSRSSGAVYGPCPAGWRVMPTIGLFSYLSYFTWNWKPNRYQVNNAPGLVFQTTGYLSSEDGHRMSGDVTGHYWTSYSTGIARSVFFNYGSMSNYWTQDYNASGNAVRCVKD
jgi:hypothetical protein